jgi:uncharacterized protein with HEPN domain
MQSLRFRVAQIQSYLDEQSFEEFIANKMVQDAVVRQLEIIGEASRNLSEDFCRLHPEVPWSQIVGMRNRIAHDYLSVDMEIVWDIIAHDLPTLKLRVAELLR